jgi:hypothetical protein
MNENGEYIAGFEFRELVYVVLTSAVELQSYGSKNLNGYCRAVVLPMQKKKKKKSPEIRQTKMCR